MSTKEDVLKALTLRAASGEELAAELGVSRAAIWKAVTALRSQGHDISAAPGRGYELRAESDVLCEATIKAHMRANVDLIVLEDTDSTNSVAKRMAIEGARDGTVVIAARQSGGRGRLGRSFISPEGGIYMSIILRPKAEAAQCARMTIAACVGVCRAIEELCGAKPSIKWVNDIFVSDRKVCGILTEAATGLESGAVEYVVVGAGINYATKAEDIPHELRGIAGSLFPDGAPLTRSVMAAGVIDRLVVALDKFDMPEIMEDYRARSMMPGRRVKILRGEGREAVATGIADDGALLVRYDDGCVEALNSGEVSVLPLN